MSDYQQRIAGSFQERQAAEPVTGRARKTCASGASFASFRSGLIVLVIVLFLARNHRLRYKHESVRTRRPDLPARAKTSALASCAGRNRDWRPRSFSATLIFSIAYVNRDAKRRGMNSALWTILVIILSSRVGFIGFVHLSSNGASRCLSCPECGTAVGARFNFCPNCKMQPSTPPVRVQARVGELDKFCPNCGND